MTDSTGIDINIGDNVLVMGLTLICEDNMFILKRHVIQDFIVAAIDESRYKMQKEVDGRLEDVNWNDLCFVCIKGVSDSDDIFYTEKSRVVFREEPCTEPCQEIREIYGNVSLDYFYRSLSMSLNSGEPEMMKLDKCKSCGKEKF